MGHTYTLHMQRVKEGTRLFCVQVNSRSIRNGLDAAS